MRFSSLFRPFLRYKRKVAQFRMTIRTKRPAILALSLNRVKPSLNFQFWFISSSRRAASRRPVLRRYFVRSPLKTVLSMNRLKPEAAPLF